MAKKTDERTKFNPSNMDVHIKTKRKFDKWHDDARTSWGTIMDRLSIFADSKGFDPRTATDDWEGEAQE